MYFGFLLGALAIAGGLLYRARLSRLLREPGTVVSDDMIRSIEERGYVDIDEPLDLEDIQEEEARFWDDQPWEEPDEY